MGLPGNMIKIPTRSHKIKKATGIFNVAKGSKGLRKSGAILSGSAQNGNCVTFTSKRDGFSSIHTKACI